MIEAEDELGRAVERLAEARTLHQVTPVVRLVARQLTRADGVTFVLREGDKCYYADESAIRPLWKGKRFPAKSCISGWVMSHGEPVVVPDVYADPRIPHAAYRPTFVKSMAMVPVRDVDPIAADRRLLGRPAHRNRRRDRDPEDPRRRQRARPRPLLTLPNAAVDLPCTDA